MIAFCAECWPWRGVEHTNCDTENGWKWRSDTFRADLSVCLSVRQRQRALPANAVECAVEGETRGFCVRQLQIENLLCTANGLLWLLSAGHHRFRKNIDAPFKILVAGSVTWSKVRTEGLQILCDRQGAGSRLPAAWRPGCMYIHLTLRLIVL